MTLPSSLDTLGAHLRSAERLLYKEGRRALSAIGTHLSYLSYTATRRLVRLQQAYSAAELGAASMAAHGC